MSRGYLSQRAYRLKLVSWAVLSAFCFILLTIIYYAAFYCFRERAKQPGFCELSVAVLPLSVNHATTLQRVRTVCLTPFRSLWALIVALRVIRS